MAVGEMNYAQAWEAEHARRPMLESQPLEPVVEFFAPYMDMEEKQHLSVLDIGCGQGTNSLWLANHGFKVCGFDSSPSAVQRLLDRFACKRNGATPTITIADITKPWPYRSQSFDIAFEVRVIENLNAKEAQFAYKQIGRVLKEGGIFLCLTASERRPGRYTTCGKVRTVEDLVLADWLAAANLEIMHISREYEGTLEDWKVIAKRV